MKYKSKVIPNLKHYTMNTCELVKVKLHIFSTLEPEGSELLAFRSEGFTPTE
jgi:hypothetical protein